MVLQQVVEIVHLHHLVQISGGCLHQAIPQLLKRPLIQQHRNLPVRALQRQDEIQLRHRLHVRYNVFIIY